MSTPAALAPKCECWCHRPRGQKARVYVYCASCCEGKPGIKAFGNEPLEEPEYIGTSTVNGVKTTWKKNQNGQLVKCVEGKAPIVFGHAAAASGSTASGWSDKCNGKPHNGLKVVEIGGFPVRFGARWDISIEALKASTLLLPLNGELPKEMPFGYVATIVNCTLVDHGGVPSNWKEFIQGVAKAMKKGAKPLAWCMGSHGRTGCLGASLIAVMEPKVLDPIAEIRKRHCEKAVESRAQAEAIFALKGQPLPEVYEKEFTFHSTSYAGSTAGNDFQKPVEITLENGQKAIKYYHCIKCRCGKCSGQNYWLVGVPCGCPNKKCEKIRKVLAQAAKAKPHQWHCTCDPCIESFAKGKHTANDATCNCADCYKREIRARKKGLQEAELCLDCAKALKLCCCAQDEVTCKTCGKIDCPCWCSVPPLSECECELQKTATAVVDNVAHVTGGTEMHPVGCICMDCVKDYYHGYVGD